MRKLNAKTKVNGHEKSHLSNLWAGAS